LILPFEIIPKLLFQPTNPLLKVIPYWNLALASSQSSSFINFPPLPATFTSLISQVLFDYKGVLSICDVQKFLDIQIVRA